MSNDAKPPHNVSATFASHGQPPSVVARTYDIVATQYADTFANEHDRKPMDRQMLGRFVREVGARTPVWDLGCGPGQTTAYLKQLGLSASGLDLSEGLLAQARARHPGITFRQGNILDLDFENSSVAAIVSFYAIVHFSHEQVRMAFREMWRVLQPAGLLLIAYHIGDETIHVTEFLGRSVDVDFAFFKPQFITEALGDAGFSNIETIEREPYAGVEYQSRRAYVFARKA